MIIMKVDPQGQNSGMKKSFLKHLYFAGDNSIKKYALSEFNRSNLLIAFTFYIRMKQSVIHLSSLKISNSRPQMFADLFGHKERSFKENKR